MDILGFINHNVLGGIFSWIIGGAIAGYVVIWINKQIRSLIDSQKNMIESKINSIKDEELRQIAYHAVRYVANKLPKDLNSDQKFVEAKNFIKAAIPDILISDSKLDLIIESAYQDYKLMLSNIGK